MRCAVECRASRSSERDAHAGSRVMTDGRHAAQIRRIGDFTLTWGESLRWDARRERLYFVDCATHTLHWLDRGEPPLHAMKLPSLPTGTELTDGEDVVVCLGDGLQVVDPDAGTIAMLAPYPD